MSTLRVNTLQTQAGVEVYTAKAWVNFNGTGTVAIRAAGNVSSITDNGTGDYTVNFTVAFADTNYAVLTASRNSTVSTSNSGYAGGASVAAYTTTSVRVWHSNITASGSAGSIVTYPDTAFYNVVVFR